MIQYSTFNLTSNNYRTRMSEEAKDTRLLREAIEERDSTKFLGAADILHYADLAEIYQSLNDEERSFFSDHIDKETFADVITDLPDTLVEETMERLDAEEQREILDQVEINKNLCK